MRIDLQHPRTSNTDIIQQQPQNVQERSAPAHSRTRPSSQRRRPDPTRPRGDLPARRPSPPRALAPTPLGRAPQLPPPPRPLAPLHRRPLLAKPFPFPKQHSLNNPFRWRPQHPTNQTKDLRVTPVLALVASKRYRHSSQQQQYHGGVFALGQ